MTAASKLTSMDRLLVFAPHPDDETLATGELIQAACAVGANVRVIFATDGDNNPWPQRWLERRWRIDAPARARWGARRRREAMDALAVLGVDGADGARFLGWPDQGLTAALMADDGAVALLAEEIARFAPTQVAVPMLADRHPDHSALRVMVDLALLRAGVACTRLGYVVHGTEQPEDVRNRADEAGYQQRKQQAMLAHTSQIALSRRRLLALAARAEVFEVVDAGTGVPDRSSDRLRIAHGPDWAFRRRHELLLIIATRTGDLRFRGVVPRFPQSRAIVLSDTQGHALQVDWTNDAALVTLPPLASPAIAIYAKLDRVRPRVIIFDREPWRDAAGLLDTAQVAALTRRAAAGLT
ncbi:MAG TPA: PIG-L family deacetylase [Dokdonella sp.]